MEFQNSKKDPSLMWIYGRHAVFAALKNKNREVIKVLVLKNQKEIHLEFKNLQYVNAEVFENLFGGSASTQGIAALVRKLDPFYLEDLIKEDDLNPIIMLDQLNDPQNLGSILRASAAFGAKCVVIPEKNSVDLTPVAIKIASGGAEIIPLVKVTNLSRSIELLKKNNFWIFGLDEKGEKNIYDVTLQGKTAIIIGNEGSGLRRLTKEKCDFLIKIPSTKNFSTLNAAQAATVVLYESFKQRN